MRTKAGTLLTTTTSTRPGRRCDEVRLGGGETASEPDILALTDRKYSTDSGVRSGRDRAEPHVRFDTVHDAQFFAVGAR